MSKKVFNVADMYLYTHRFRGQENITELNDEVIKGMEDMGEIDYHDITDSEAVIMDKVDYYGFCSPSTIKDTNGKIHTIRHMDITITMGYPDKKLLNKMWEFIKKCDSDELGAVFTKVTDTNTDTKDEDGFMHLGVKAGGPMDYFLKTKRQLNLENDNDFRVMVDYRREYTANEDIAMNGADLWQYITGTAHDPAIFEIDTVYYRKYLAKLDEYNMDDKALEDLFVYLATKCDMVKYNVGEIRRGIPYRVRMIKPYGTLPRKMYDDALTNRYRYVARRIIRGCDVSYNDMTSEEKKAYKELLDEGYQGVPVVPVTEKRSKARAAENKKNRKMQAAAAKPASIETLDRAIRECIGSAKESESKPSSSEDHSRN